MKMESLVEVEHNENDEKPKGLTKMDLKALKRADMIAFHLSEIEAIKEIHNDPFETEKRYSIPVEYKADGDVKKAFHMKFAPKMDMAWQTIVSLLRVGDVIILDWKKGALTNDLLRKAGLVEDALYLHVRRKGKPKYTFLVDTQTGRAANGGMVR